MPLVHDGSKTLSLLAREHSSHVWVGHFNVPTVFQPGSDGVPSTHVSCTQHALKKL